MLISTGKLKQVGTIMYGNGLNAAEWILRARAEGYRVLLCDGYAALYK